MSAPSIGLTVKIWAYLPLLTKSALGNRLYNSVINAFFGFRVTQLSSKSFIPHTATGMDASGSYCQPWKAVNNGVLIGMSDFEKPARA